MRWSCFGVFCVATLAGATPGCRRADPPPSHHEDLGDESRPLLPTAQTWQPDRHVLDGTAEFQPLREPKLEDKPAAGSPAEGAESGGGAADATLKEELAAMVQDHNDALVEGAPDKISDFYVEAQIEPVQSAVTALNAARDKLRELAPALPERKDDIERLAGLLSPDVLLKINLGAVQSKGAEEASATLGKTPPLMILPGVPAEEAPQGVTFRLGENDWYIDSPVVAVLVQATGQLNELVPSLDAIIPDAKAGNAKARDLAERAPILAGMLERLPPPGEEAAPATGDGESAGEDDAGEEGGEEGEAPADNDGEATPESDNGGEPD